MKVTVLPCAQAVDDVLEQHEAVGSAQERVELVVDLGLAAGAHLVVPTLELQPAGGQVAHHRGAQVAEVVERLDREVATLGAGLVAEVRAAVLAGQGAGVPGALHRVDVVVALVDAGAVTDRVEDVELRLRPEVGGVGDPAAGQVGLGLLRHVARVAAVGLARDRVVDEEVHVQGLVHPERVEEGAVGVGQQQHVRLVDRLETADRGPVEAQSVGEGVLAEGRCRDGEVLHDAGQVAETHVDVLDVVVTDVGRDLVGTGEHRSSGCDEQSVATYERGVARRCPECFGAVTRRPPCHG
jgi:hypothetical protein